MRLVMIATVMLGCLARAASAAPLVLSGDLDDAGNTALYWSDLGPALFDNDGNIANNVAIYELSVAADSTVTFTSSGYLLGGIEPYFSVFSGTGNAATFVTSNEIEDLFNIDFSFSLALLAGDYMLTIGSWVNQPFAWNNPDGDPTLGDGFTGLGVPSAGTYFYEVSLDCVAVTAADPCDVADGTITPVPVAEPASLLLMAVGLGAAARLRRRRSPEASTPSTWTATTLRNPPAELS